jgi:hypothetical protein
MRSVLRTACLWAVPLEVFNFWVVGYPAATHSLSSASQNAALALQWYVLHLPGIIVVDHSSFLRLHQWAYSPVLLLLGYLDTAVLILGILWLVGLAKRIVRRLSSPARGEASSEETRSTRLSA